MRPLACPPLLLDTQRRNGGHGARAPLPTLRLLAPQCFVTTLHFVTTASLITPASCAQATSSTFSEISLPMNPFSCAVCASLLVTIWKVSGPVSRLQSPFGGGSRRGSLTSW